MPNTELRTFPNRLSLPDLSILSQSTSWNPVLSEASPSTPYAAHSSLSAPGPSQPISWNPSVDGTAPSYNYEDSPHYHLRTLSPNHHNSLPPLSGTDESFTSFIPLTPRPQTPPPFQFASSSLSTALSDPHVSKPLPPVHLNSPQPQYPTDLDLDSNPNSSDRFNTCKSLASSNLHGLRNTVYDEDDVEMSENMFFDHEQRSPISDIRTRDVGGNCGELENRVLQESSNIHREPLEASHMVCSTASTSSSPLHYPSPRDFLPSASTTPIVSPLSLSPPNPSTPIDLPSANAIPNSSVLFSSHYPLGPKKKRTFARRRDESDGPLRLDSALPATAE